MPRTATRTTAAPFEEIVIIVVKLVAF